MPAFLGIYKLASNAFMSSRSNKPKINVIHNLARSGGTLISKCLASMNSIVLLSEIHPTAQHAVSFNALRQAQQWYGIGLDQNWQKVSFIDAIHIIHQHCQKHNLHLVIRDWSHVDYLGLPVTKQPKNIAELTRKLEADFDICSIQVIRHPLDTWLSTRRLNLIKQSDIDEEKFLTAFQTYLLETKANYRLIFEKFLENPDFELKTICEVMEIPYDPNYKHLWYSYTKITGDMSNSSSLRNKPTISLRKRKPFNPIILDELEKHTSYAEILATVPSYI